MINMSEKTFKKWTKKKHFRGLRVNLDTFKIHAKIRTLFLLAKLNLIEEHEISNVTPTEEVVESFDGQIISTVRGKFILKVTQEKEISMFKHFFTTKKGKEIFVMIDDYRETYTLKFWARCVQFSVKFNDRTPMVVLTPETNAIHFQPDFIPKFFTGDLDAKVEIPKLKEERYVADFSHATFGYNINISKGRLEEEDLIKYYVDKFIQSLERDSDQINDIITGKINLFDHK